MLGEPRHSLAGVAHFGCVDGVVADDAVLLEVVERLNFIEAGGGKVVLEAVGFHISSGRCLSFIFFLSFSLGTKNSLSLSSLGDCESPPSHS